MARLNLLRDVFPSALSLVGKGANRKRFFLRKSGEVEEGGEPPEGLIGLPARHTLVKAEDWSAVYCVVAQPGWEEDPGQGAPEPDVPDRWADEEEIRKAAHRFMKNGALVNAMHANLDPYGDVVENYVCPADFTVMTPDGPETITKGSWVVVIEPNAEGREAIEKGEFTGVSLEGQGLRVPVEKGADPAPASDRDRLGDRMKNFLRKLGLAVGMTDEDLAELEADELNKASVTFAGVMAEREFEDELPDAFDALRSAIWRAFYPDPGGAEKDTTKLITQSLDEFKTWALQLLNDSTAVTKVGEQIAADVATQADFTKAAIALAAVEKSEDRLEIEMTLTADELEKSGAEDDDELVKAARKFNAATRRKYSKQGVAMSDGSFPIPDKDALKRAMKAVGRAAKGKVAAVKAHIRRRAKALGATAMLSESFAKDAPDETSGSVEDEMGLSAEEREQLDGLNKAVAELPDKIAASLKDVFKSDPPAADPPAADPPKSDPPAADPPKGDPPATPDPPKAEPTAVEKAIADLTAKVEKLGSGETAQKFDPEDPETIRKADTLKKEFEARGLPPELVGLHSGLAGELVGSDR